MTTQLQIRRGSTLENDAFVGAEGEITYDFQEKKLHIHDGQTPGGKLIGTNHFAPNIFDCKWADHTLDDPSWLRADTFGWQDGTLYKIAYNHLVDDYTNGTTQSETVSGITINYKRAADGHKIVDASAENSIVSIYNNTNIAWYYILDTENQRFKLPRTRFGFTGIRNTVGNYVAPGLPNITGYTSLAARTASTGYLGGFVNTGGALYASSEVTTSHGLGGGDNSADNKRLNIDASRSNSIYGASTTVQSPATQMYLYFYVGEFIHTPLANEYTNTWISNCVTEIPQDIKLELNNGTLTLKAGSKVYAPNGVDVFDDVVITNDISSNSFAGSIARFVLIDINNNTITAASAVFSGPTSPTLSGVGFWYDTVNNIIRRTTDGGTTWTTGYSFPIAIVTSVSDVATSIDQVFNGFGYIGSTVFALPGVKGLIPNGRNADGTLKSTSFTTSTVLTQTRNIAGTYKPLVLKSNSFSNYATANYDPINNFNIGGTGNDIGMAIVGTWSADSDGKITYFNAKTTFHATDYNDISNIFNMIYPIGAVYIGTQSTCPMSLVIPGSTWELVSTGRALWGGDGTNGGTTIAAGLPNIWGGFTAKSMYGETYGAFSSARGASAPGYSGGWYSYNFGFDASRSSSIYGNSSTVQPPAYVINVWRRTA